MNCQSVSPTRPTAPTSSPVFLLLLFLLTQQSILFVLGLSRKRRTVAAKKICSYLFDRAMRPRGILMRFYQRRFQDSVLQHSELIQRQTASGKGVGGGGYAMIGSPKSLS